MRLYVSRVRYEKWWESARLSPLFRIASNKMLDKGQGMRLILVPPWISVHVYSYRECTFCTLKLFTDYQTTCKCHVNFWYHHTCILLYSPSHSRKRIRIWLSKWQNWVTKSLWVQCILVYRYCTHFMKVYMFTHVLCSKFLSWENIFGNFKFFQQFHKSFSPAYLNTASL